MKILISALLFAVQVAKIHAAGYFGYGLPVYLDQNTNTIEHYSPALPEPIRSHSHGNSFANSLKSSINANYPGIYVNRVDHRDAAVTYNFLVNDGSIQSYEMIFYSGHGKIGASGDNTGNEAAFVTYEHGFVRPSSKTYGTWNRWVFTDFCQFLRNHNPYFYQNMFGGLHAVFGYESNMYFYIYGYDCFPWGCGGHDRSEDKWIPFGPNWAKPNGKKMWDDYKDINLYEQYVVGHSSNAPAVVYNAYIGWQGASIFLGHTEYITNIFNGDVPIGTLKHEYVINGTPTYN
ncbi:MAG: hypothetical protein JWO30_289 [Fibrobacteres bacterium]|nr:hypothetical protein [Fibrobacterota bacterium]